MSGLSWIAWGSSSSSTPRIPGLVQYAGFPAETTRCEHSPREARPPVVASTPPPALGERTGQPASTLIAAVHAAGCRVVTVSSVSEAVLLLLQCCWCRGTVAVLLRCERSSVCERCGLSVSVLCCCREKSSVCELCWCCRCRRRGAVAVAEPVLSLSTPASSTRDPGFRRRRRCPQCSVSPSETRCPLCRRCQRCRPQRAVGIVDAAVIKPVEIVDTHTCRCRDRHPPVATRSHTQSIVDAAVTSNVPSGVDIVEIATHQPVELTRATVSSLPLSTLSLQWSLGVDLAAAAVHTIEITTPLSSSTPLRHYSLPGRQPCCHYI